MKKISLVTTVSVALVLNACGSTQSKSRYRVYDKKASPAYIKINKLDLANNRIQLRFEYRSYVYDVLENMSCNIVFGDNSLTEIVMTKSIKIDAFSVEALNFDNINISSKQQLLERKDINYSLDCLLKYDRGRESVYNDSVLHLVPSTSQQYR